ncbi:hypothetical protein DID88_009170 [Monilinia fructigena]|uniref:RTA1 domain protein n=1 Tax=Monilinia fructigena TaxID=38457 RepID=A0A395IEG8_9HELO|nr:hypothetical protein DID88_009170 [Monilinia fructigena]
MTNLTHSDGDGAGYGNITLLMNPHLCTLDTCDLSLASFEYLPTVAGNTIYAVVFGILLFAQLGLGIKFKTWGYMVAMIFGLILEIVGYIGRILLHYSPFDNNDFLMYLICLTIAPAFLTAAIYLCLSRIVIIYGQEISRFKPGTYTIIFCTCDIISLLLQAVGGAIASLGKTASQVDVGKNIMLAGLAFQVFSLLLFAILCAEFAWRVHSAKGTWNPRCVELSGGFGGTLFVSHEPEFMILEGVMIVLATGGLTLLHPGIAMQGAWLEANFKFRSPDEESETSKRESSGSDIEMGSRRTFARK